MIVAYIMKSKDVATFSPLKLTNRIKKGVNLMFYQHRRRFAFALAVCLLFGLLPGTSRAEQMQTEPVADTPAAETVETNVPAVEMPTDTYEVIEAEQVSLSESEIRVNQGSLV